MEVAAAIGPAEETVSPWATANHLRGATWPASGAPEDGWAIFAQPPGLRDLGLVDYWTASHERSLRRRAVRRRPRIVAKGHARVSLALAAAALGGPVVGGAVAAQEAAASTTTSLALGQGDRGPKVAALQRALGIAADGVFGPQTLHAVLAFQRAHGIPATGYVGPLTTAALGAGVATTRSDQSPGAAAPPSAAPGLDLPTIEAAQRSLGVSADGVVGPITRHAIRAFQAAHGLTVDGVLGPATLAALGAGGQSRGGSPASPQPTTVSTAPAAASGVQAAVAAAMSRIGDPYRSGGTSPGGFDCSGLVYWAMHQAGLSVPRTSFAQYGIGARVASSQIQAGDLVFFDTAGPGASDVGIAISSTTAVSSTTHGVMTHAILSGYWGDHFVGARRIV